MTAPDQTNAEVSDERPIAWRGWWSGAGSIDSTTRTTHIERIAKQWAEEGAEVTPLVALNRRSVTSQASDGAMVALTAAEIQSPKTLDEWSEEDGDVVWWCWRDGAWLAEPAYIGTPLDLGQTVEIELRSNQGEFIHSHTVGGWPGYHTHWTPHPAFPRALSNQQEGTK